jgi:Putative binding domain, N-terminal/Viral BACON domain
MGRVAVISVVVGIAGGFLSAGCGSSSSTVTSPTTIMRCSVTTNGGGNVPAQGGAGTITVSAARECAWSASTDGAWLTIRAGANGQGDGTVEFAASANPDPVVRRGAVILNERRVDVTQSAGECTISLAEGGATFGSEGGSGRVEVRASSGLCTWTASSDAGWIVLRADGNGKGSAQLPFDVAATTGPPRTGTLTVAGQRFAVTQSQGCSYAINPSSFAAPSSGGNGSIAVATAANCPWTATSSAGWVTLAQKAGDGPGTVAFNVAASNGARTATISIAGETFTITQSQAPPPPPPPGPAPPPAPPPAPAPSPSCRYAIAPEQRNVDVSGGTFDVAVTTSAGCPWTSSSNAAWITVRDTGAGSTQVTVAANQEGARVGTATIAGRTLTVNQAARQSSCRVSVRPHDVDVDSRGRLLQVEVEATPGCSWTATTEESWIHIFSGRSGSGNGQVTLAIEENNGKKRKGEVVIGTEKVKIEQKEG